MTHLLHVPVIVICLSVSPQLASAQPNSEGPVSEKRVEYVRSENLTKWDREIEEAIRRFGMPRAWIEGVIMAESAGKTTLNGRPITSRAGAMGLMQLMPTTYANMRDKFGLGADPYDPGDNILAGTAYLRDMYDRFGYPGLFAAYNAGPERYAASLRGTRLPAETRLYLATLTRHAPRILSGTDLFFGAQVSGLDAETAKSSVFVPLFLPDSNKK